jgi:anti-sigma factor RsiW
MTASSSPVSKAELHAYADGRLDDARRQEVAAHVAENADAADRVAAYEAQNKALHILFDPALYEAPPRRLKPPAMPRTLVHMFWAAASVVLLVMGGAIGWFVHENYRADVFPTITVARQAAVAHTVFTPQKRHPVEVTADEEVHLVKWLSKVLGKPLRAPRLSGLGFALVGGRLLSAPDGPAAQFMYEDTDGRRITVYVATDARWQGETAFRYAAQGNVGVFYWIEGPFGYAVTANMPRPELIGIARAVYTELKP